MELKWKKDQWKKKSYGKEELKILRSFSQPQNEPSQLEEKDEYTLLYKCVSSKMRKLSSLLDMDQMFSLEFELTGYIQNARQERFVV